MTSSAKLKFEGYTVKNAQISVENSIAGEDIEIGLAPSGVLDTSHNRFVLRLGVQVSDKLKTFRISIDIEARFKYEGDEDIIHPFLVKNAPAIIFPYIRAYVSSLSALSGIPCILLPTLNMQGLEKELEEHIRRV